MGLRDFVIGWDELRELADLDEERTKGLADFVVKFAGDGAALFFLSFDEAGGEAFELETAEGESLIALASLTLEAEDVPAADERHQDASDESESDHPDEAGFQRLKTSGDGEIFEGEFSFVERGNLRREFKDTRAPGNKLLANELIGALAAKIGAPGQCDGAGAFFFLELLLHCCEEELLIGIPVDGETE